MKTILRLGACVKCILPFHFGSCDGIRSTHHRCHRTGARTKSVISRRWQTARYEVDPTFAEPGRIQISLPDGRTNCPDDPDASAIVSDFLGHSVRLENQPASDEKTGIDRATVFGDVPVSAMKEEWTPNPCPTTSN